MACGKRTANATIPEHNWDKYDWGPGPAVPDRLYQGPFPQYGPCAVVPDSDVAMVTTPSKEIVSNYGMGLIVYVSDDTGPLQIPGQSMEQTLEDLIKLPIAQKIYLRPNWREVQKQPGRLDFPEWWKITFDLARRYNKQIGFRVQLENPDVADPGMPDFLLDKVPYVKLKGEWKGNPAEMRYRKDNRVPRYDAPAYQAAFRELNELLAAELNGNPQVEFMDTMMYGFWGEGHTWPYEGNPFPSNLVAEQTWSAMFEMQLEQWTKVPLATNTQPDFSNVGQRRVARSHDAHRQLVAYGHNLYREHANRGVEQPSSLGRGDLRGWFHHRRSERTSHRRRRNYLQRTDHFPRGRCWSQLSFAFGVGTTSPPAASRAITTNFRSPSMQIARQIGYRIRPSFLWTFQRDGVPGLVIGLANDGIAAVPGVLRLSVFSEDNKINVSGCVDAGYPKPTGIHQAMLMLPAGAKWEGLRLKAELEVKGMRYPVRWACRQKVNPDGSLTLRHNYKPDQPLV